MSVNKCQFRSSYSIEKKLSIASSFQVEVRCLSSFFSEVDINLEGTGTSRCSNCFSLSATCRLLDRGLVAFSPGNIFVWFTPHYPTSTWPIRTTLLSARPDTSVWSRGKNWHRCSIKASLWNSLKISYFSRGQTFKGNYSGLVTELQEYKHIIYCVINL